MLLELSKLPRVLYMMVLSFHFQKFESIHEDKFLTPH